MIRWCLARYMYTIWDRTVHLSSNGAHRHTSDLGSKQVSLAKTNRSLSPFLIFLLWSIKQHPTKRTLSPFRHQTASNMLNSIWRHSGNNSTCPCLWQVSLSFFLDGRQIPTH
jgi:hypothetical protein